MATTNSSARAARGATCGTSMLLTISLLSVVSIMPGFVLGQDDPAWFAMIERQALLKFKGQAYAWRPGSAIGGWQENMPTCHWPGVACNGDGRITKLQLTFNGISGSLPVEFMHLTELKELWLLKNYITGTLPPEWSHLQKLRVLYAGQNKITGTLPEQWYTLTSLERMLLFFNQLTGTLPPKWSSIPNLKHLDIQGNQLSGALPAEYNEMTSLEKLILARNNLQGGLPSEWQTLVNVDSMDLSSNKLSDTTIPPSYPPSLAAAIILDGNNA